MGRILEWVSFTPLQNATGDPAISLPMGMSSKGLPIGVQLAAAQGYDRRLHRGGLRARGGPAVRPDPGLSRLGLPVTDVIRIDASSDQFV